MASRQGHGIVEGSGGLHERQHFIDGFAERHEALVQDAFPFRGPNAFELAAHGGEKGVTVQVLVLIKVIADAHAHGIERRRLVGETGDHDGDDVGIEEVQILKQLQPVVARAQVPIEDGPDRRCADWPERGRLPHRQAAKMRQSSPAPSSHSRKVLRTGSSSSTMRMVSTGLASTAGGMAKTSRAKKCKSYPSRSSSGCLAARRGNELPHYQPSRKLVVRQFIAAVPAREPRASALARGSRLNLGSPWTPMRGGNHPGGDS